MDRLDNRPGIELTVTVDYFGEEDFETLKERLEPHFRVGGGPAYDFSEAEVAHIVVGFLMSTLQAVPSSLLTSVLYDGLKALLLRAKASGRNTTLEFSVRDGEQYVYALLETNQEEDLEKGLATLKELARPEYKGESFELEPETQRWKKRT